MNPVGASRASGSSGAGGSHDTVCAVSTGRAGGSHGARAGLGYLITYGSQVFAMTMVVTAIVVLLLMSVVLYQAIALIEKHFIR